MSNTDGSPVEPTYRFALNGLDRGHGRAMMFIGWQSLLTPYTVLYEDALFTQLKGTATGGTPTGLYNTLSITNPGLDRSVVVS